MGRKKMTRLLLANMAAGAWGAAVLLSAGNAHADVDQFTADMQHDGIPVDATVISVGYNICTDTQLNGIAGIKRQIAMGIRGGLDSRSVAVTIVDSISDLCPENSALLNQFLDEDKSGPSTSADRPVLKRAE